MALYYPTETNAVQKTLDAALLAGATTAVTLNNVTKIQNKPGVFVVDRVDANGTATPSKREYVAYTAVSGSTLTGLTRNADGGGSDQDHSVGAIVEFVSDVLQQQEILDILDGTDSGATLTSPVINTSVSGTAVKDEDDMTSNSATALATQQSIKAYVDSGTVTMTNKTLTAPKLNGTVALTSTATELNALDGQTGAWTPYTPSWTNVTIGNATVAAAYNQIGKTVHVRLKFIYGSTTNITGTITFSLPVTMASIAPVGIGTSYIEDNGVAGYMGFIRATNTTTAILISYSNATCNATVPFTWASTDYFSCYFTYEAA